eukprot:m.150208 g.150208  ORF g.150208 m.150208 type:complete len:319 (-) comp16877_c0_seq1:2428-3384(-)
MAEEDPCALVLEEEYDRPLHIGAIFILMGVSLLGTATPWLLTRMGYSHKDSIIMPCGKLFGAGVIIATGLVHMLGPSMEAFSNTDCLPAVFSDYEAFSGMIAVLAIMTTHLLQLLAREHAEHNQKNANSKKALLPQSNGNGNHGHSESEEGHSHSLLLASEKRITTFALEFGVATHSVIIGIALGVARENFKELLIALSFHQFFEGLALMTVVMEAEFSHVMYRIMFMLFYVTTTPLGIAIGVGINDSYNENGRSALLVNGSLDAISAGILIYDGLCNIIQPHFMSSGYRDRSVWVKVAQVVCMWTGAGIMSFIGKYA